MAALSFIKFSPIFDTQRDLFFYALARARARLSKLLLYARLPLSVIIPDLNERKR